MRKKTVPDPTKKELPIFDLKAFGKKTTWSDFYIQNINDHVKEHEFVGRPHKHNFYLIFFVSGGDGVHIIDFVHHPIQPNTIFLMTPGQVHTWTLSKDIEGFIVFFTREFYQLRLSENNLLEFPFYHSLAASPVIRPPANDVFGFVLRKMYEEYNGTNTPDLRTLRAYLDLFLLEAAKYYDGSHAAITHGNTFRIRKLEQLIDENFRTLKHPSDYGELMNLAPGYVNSICKDSLGKTLTDLIQERLLLEAKRMLAYSDMNVNEVSEELSFSDPSYFVRWFKKQNGGTAEEFRRSI